MNELQQILKAQNLNLSENPSGTDKGDKKSYIDKYYARVFAQYRFEKMRLLEIGCRHGASLALWSSYFPKGEIIGCDNLADVSLSDDLPVVKEWVERENVKLIIADAYTKEAANKLEGQFDIIIDDGPHTLKSQQIAMDLYLPKLAPKGILVIEDILTGGAAILPLLRHMPKGFTASFHDFRLDKMCGDNCIFEVRNCPPSIWESLKVLGLGYFYAIAEGPLRSLLRLRRKS